MSIELGIIGVTLLRCVVAQFPSNQDIPPNIDLYTLSSNSPFLWWRPTYHVAAPVDHQNDSCGPMYDNVTDTYHVFYQTFPQHVHFGNTAWGHAASKDLITWHDAISWENRSAVALCRFLTERTIGSVIFLVAPTLLVWLVKGMVVSRSCSLVTKLSQTSGGLLTNALLRPKTLQRAAMGASLGKSIKAIHGL